MFFCTHLLVCHIGSVWRWINFLFPSSRVLILCTCYKYLNRRWHRFVVLRLTGCTGLLANRSSGKSGNSSNFLRLLLQDWGRAGDVTTLGVCWHVPSQEEEDFVFQLLSRLLHPELQRIKGHVSGEKPMTRCPVVCLSFRSLDVLRHACGQK